MSTSASEGENVINYANKHHCFYNHTAAPYRFYDQLRHIEASAEPTKADGFVDQADLMTIPLPHPIIQTEPLLNHEFYEPPTDPNIPASLIFPSLRTNGHTRLPLEMIDTGFDMKKEITQYLNDVQAANSCDLLIQWLPLSYVSTENDESLEFPSTVSRWQTLASRELQSVETTVSQQSLLSLHDQDMFREVCTPVRVRDIFCLSNRPHAYLEPMSCPLSPASELDEPFAPNSEVLIIDMTSEPSSPVINVIKELDINIYNDSIEPEPAVPSTMSSTPPAANVVFLGSKPNKPSEPRLDVPILVSSPEEGFFEEAFQTILEDKADKTNRQLEQERLNPADYLRLPTPAADFHIPNPEWNTHLANPQEQFAWLQQTNTSSFHLPCFEGLRRLEASLKWTPVPYGSGRVSLNESAMDLGPVGRELLTLHAPQLCSRNFIYPRHEVQVLRISEDEAIELDVASSHRTTSSILEENLGICAITNKADDPLVTPSLDDLLRSRSQTLRRKVGDKAENILPETAGSSGVGSLLTQFIHLRHPKRLKTTRGSSQPRATSAVLPHMNVSHALSDIQEDLSDKPREALVPVFDLPIETCRYIVSLSMSRKTLYHIEKSWQHVELIDRDFSRYNTLVWSPGSAQRKEVISSLAFEADISLCPAAGLILTTILKVKQKPLPGSTGLTSFRERVRLVSEKYETLFVLVSEANPLGEYIGSPTASDIAGYADFVRFTMGLKGGVSTFLVSGSEETASKWALSIMSRYSSPAKQFRDFLNFRDGVWELFLRRTGLNVSAAQVVAGLLMSEYGELGLAKFFSMDAEQRVSRYGQIMGGKRILDNTSRVLDREWV
ncbi:hypothetical protein FHETE_1060 [Fusarium heterosporum]|uniref:Uncharacterized protein n=1 Tax=Fusarium heterosporum TaxID=42747 RepID=A0A8H5TUW9_FUSHE|nr:hypothetical protein FHETE_1060 [Fusarium heterosporum]